MFDPCPLPVRRLGWAVIATLAAFSLAACENHPHHRGNPNEMDAGIPKVSLHASGTFFAGQLVAEATVSRGLHERVVDDPSGRTSRPIENRFGGMSRGDGDGDRGGRHGERREEGGMGSRFGGEGMARLGSNAPPITLRVRLKNQGKTHLQVTIRDVNSVLGNFVPQPEKVLLAPGQSADLDPMISRLGVVAAEIPLTLSFRVGDKTETQQLNLRTDPPAATATGTP